MPAALQFYRYTPNTLVGDYLRAVIGLAVGLGVLIHAGDSTSIDIIFGIISAIFGFFLIRTVQRHVTRVALTEDELARMDFVTRRFAWNRLSRLKLRYFGTRRERKEDSDGRPIGGFWQMALTGDGKSMTFESNLEGFEMLAWRAARAARENGVSIDPSTAGNLLSLGVNADGESPPPNGVGLPGGPALKPETGD